MFFFFDFIDDQDIVDQDFSNRKSKVTANLAVPIGTV